MSTHQEIISGAVCSISLFVVSIFPTVAEIAKGLDFYIVILMHSLQTIAAFCAIVHLRNTASDSFLASFWFHRNLGIVAAEVPVCLGFAVFFG